MTTRTAIDDFVSCRTLALVGASRSGKGFGNAVLQELSSKGYRILPVHPSGLAPDGRACATSLAALAETAEGVIIVVPPSETERVVRDAHAAGITRVWMQRGAESADAVQFCEEKRMNVVAGECILMFAHGVEFPHTFHRWVTSLFRRLPAGIPTAR
jgi:predicted CoA-binding protein